MTTPSPQAPPPRPANVPKPIQFGLCGATSSGKTTFLIALSLAVHDAQEKGLGTWAMIDADEPSRKFIQDGQQDLATHKKFPAASVLESSLSWHVWGTRRGLVGDKPVSFTLDVDDIPGNAFLLNAQTAGAQMSQDSLDRLANADALIFLVDPIRERERGPHDPSNWNYFVNLVRTITSEYRHKLRKGRLPHHVVVCVTKFDEPSIFRDAFAAGMIDVAPGGQPHVPDDRAREYFQWMCKWVDEVQGDGSTQLLLKQLEGSFIPDRVHYFASSSIGFFLQDEDFNIEDFENVREVGGESRVRGAVTPINVLEPLINLERRIRKEK